MNEAEMELQRELNELKMELVDFPQFLAHFIDLFERVIVCNAHASMRSEDLNDYFYKVGNGIVRDLNKLSLKIQRGLATIVQAEVIYN